MNVIFPTLILQLKIKFRRKKKKVNWRAKITHGLDLKTNKKT